MGQLLLSENDFSILKQGIMELLLLISQSVVFAHWLFKGHMLIVANLEFFFKLNFIYLFIYCLFAVLGIELKTFKPCLL